MLWFHHVNITTKSLVPLESLLTLSNNTSKCNNSAAEIYIIRHGEKDTLHHNMDTVYNLSPKGWDRANYLAQLVSTKRWPVFGAVFASKYATFQQAQDAWPNVVTCKGQSMPRREYQTVLPMAQQLHLTPNVQFAKHQVHEVAMAATRASIATCRPVLISWDHCSLPTLVVQGFQCRNSQTCQRCWADALFDDVLKLRVQLVQNQTISSTVLQMTRECYPGYNNQTVDRSYELPSLQELEQSVDARDTTPCLASYCTDRPEAATMVPCLCFESDSNHSHWRPLIQQESN